MKKFSKFDIPFVGLNLGSHSYDFKVDKAFFDLFEYCAINDGFFDVQLELDKKENMLILDFNLSGSVTDDCDRCGGEMTFPASYTDRIYIQFGNEESDNENIIFYPINAHKINIATLIEEFAVLSLPVRKLHKDGQCDEKALERLEELNKQDPQEIDPRWEKLKGLLKD